MKKFKKLILITIFLIIACELSASFFFNPLAYFKGIKDARKDIAENIFQQLYIGEPGPVRYLDLETGLPFISLGCILTESKEIYARSYNKYVQRFIVNSPPFPESLIVEYSITSPQINQKLTLYSDKAILDNGYSRVSFSPDKASLYKIGILSREIFGISVPASMFSSPTHYFLTIIHGDKEWNISFDVNTSYIPKDLLDALEFIRNTSL